MYKRQSYSQVCQLLQGCNGERSRYLFALACFKLDKLDKAERALTSSKKFGVEEFLKNGQDPGKESGHLGRDFFGGISMGVSSGLLSQKPKTNYSEFYPSNPETGQHGTNALFMPQKKGGTSQYLLNWTKKGLNTFTDFFGKKRKKKQGDETLGDNNGVNSNKIKDENAQDSKIYLFYNF